MRYGSLITTSGCGIGLNVIDNFFNILDGLSPDQVFVTSLGFLIEQLCGLEPALELFSVLSCSQSDSELLNLCLTLSEVLHEPHVGLLSVGHWLQHALRCFRNYNDVKGTS